jgi:predicted aldo/keto reductase-like oxidoreductase
MKTNSSRRDFLAAAAGASGLAPAPPVRYSALGRTGLRVTKFIFGSMITTDPSLIARAVDTGINCFASARDYQKGNNERVLAAGLGDRRKDVVLVTESIDMNWRSGEVETTEYALETLRTSLRELKTDYVDLWLLHHKDSPGDLNEDVLEAVRKAKRQGSVRFAGVSTHALPAIVDVLLKQDLLDVVMPIYNFTVDAEMHEAVAKAHKAGLGVIAMKVMAGGLRAEKPLPQLRRKGAISAALKWALNNPSVDAAVSSVASVDELEENAAAMAAPFTEGEKKLLAECLKRIGPDYCRSCGRCAGTCAKALAVSDLMRYGMYADNYRQFALGREKYLRLPEEARRPRCGECASCSVVCPYGVDVPRKIARVQELFA